MVATRDILPGELVFHESKTLVSKPSEGVTTSVGFASESIAALLKMVEEVLSKEERTTLLSLPCGNTASYELFADRTLDTLEKKRLIKVRDKAHRSMLRKVLKVTKLNGTVIFATASFVEHSCCPNCALMRVRDGSQECRAIKPIAAGSRLTASYTGLRDHVSTPERRYQLMQSFEFTCHCPRCDAPGDDTRQFACFDLQCTGRHYVRQPLSAYPLPFDDLSYMGVIYVTPHLLPCTVCKRSPPAAYQKQMFQWEQDVEPDIRKLEIATKQGGQVSLNEVMDADLRPIRHHHLGLRMAYAHYRVFHMYCRAVTKAGKLPSPQEAQFLLQRAARAAEIDQHIFPAPNLRSLTIVGNIAESLVMIEQFAEALPYCRRAVRLQALLNGRDCRDPLYDEWLARALTETQDAETPLSLEVCAFCEESPERAALKLNRCGRCRQVSYCSKGCQTAHWKGHKAQCKKV
jgi:hypothetical protein